ncbi:MAG: ORC1-type DNA replication protein [Nanoarchaeota archaeon]|nr:ORC1-type DNA replication protein [Nanoarchaeota archaeon]
MGEEELNQYFEDFLKKEPLFNNKKVLQSNYSPEIILHRENEVNKIAGILAPALRIEKPSNMFLYGKTGTGKTMTAKHVTNSIMSIAEKNNLPVKCFYLNCKLKRVADTEYRLIAELARFLGEKIPATGLPTDEVYRLFVNVLEKKKMLMILILDEIDQIIVKGGDQILYNLTRINSELKISQITLVGISNDLMFTNYLDPRVVSSLSEEEMVFPPYNAIQLQSILRERAKKAFREGVIDNGVIEKCAAFAAREHGDARRALELLRVAGELAERRNLNSINIDCIDEAEEKIERDRVHDIITTQPKQSQVALLAIFETTKAAGSRPLFTGDIYELYKELCNKSKIKALTQRRISDIIAELDMLGIISAKVISKGRYGRTRQIRLGIPLSAVPQLEELLKEALNI